MNMEWSGRATCRNCSINYSDIEPELIVQTDLGREFIFCPCCLELIPVTNTGDEMPKKPFRIKTYNVYNEKVLEEISKRGKKSEKRAKYIKHSIRVMRVKMGLDSSSF